MTYLKSYKLKKEQNYLKRLSLDDNLTPNTLKTTGEEKAINSTGRVVINIICVLTYLSTSKNYFRNYRNFLS